AQLQEIGLDSVRLGVLWAAVEPAPGEYCEEHLRWLGAQLDQLHAAGLAVILDGHQDLFSQLFGDGAPAWATLTRQPFEETALWSEPFCTHRAMLAYDLRFAPAPGSAAPQLFGAILAQVADLPVQDLETVAADFEDPAAKLAPLSPLEDAALHRRLGARLAPL